jgi:hypothetical protein
MIDKGGGKGLQRCNEAHLRRDCKRFKKVQEEARESTESDGDKAVGCLFSVDGRFSM